MAKVRDVNSKKLGPGNKNGSSKQKNEPIQVTLANAPVLSTKIQELILGESRKHTLMLADILAELRKNG